MSYLTTLVGLLLLSYWAHSQDLANSPSGTPSPKTSSAKGKTESSKLSLKKLKVINQKAEGSAVDMKNLNKPSKNDRVYWDESGARLQKLSSQSGWRRIGLKEGDVIVRLAGEDLHNQNDLQKALDKAQNTPSGSSVDLKVLRQNQVIVIDYKIKW